MVACTSCGFENDEEDGVCGKCFAFLKPTSMAHPHSTLQPLAAFAPEPQPARSKRSPEYWHTLDNFTVAMFIENGESPMLLTVADAIYLGRKSEAVQANPMLDMSMFQGFDKGVSRLHAVIRRQEGQMFIEDLGSSNGTWLNDVRLPPKEPRRLATGDRIRLGYLNLQVYMKLRTQPIHPLGLATQIFPDSAQPPARIEHGPMLTFPGTLAKPAIPDVPLHPEDTPALPMPPGSEAARTLLPDFMARPHEMPPAPRYDENDLSSPPDSDLPK